MNSFPEATRDFNFNFRSNRKDIDYYQKALENIFPKVTMELNLYNFKINNIQLGKLLIANKNGINWIGFIECKFENHIDFGDRIDGANFKGLSLSGSKFTNSNDWEHHPERFSNLIQALSKVRTVRESMDRIWLVDSGLEEDWIRNILDNHGLRNVEIKRHSV